MFRLTISIPTICAAHFLFAKCGKTARLLVVRLFALNGYHWTNCYPMIAHAVEAASKAGQVASPK
jgi:hypothetical protein